MPSYSVIWNFSLDHDLVSVLSTEKYLLLIINCIIFFDSPIFHLNAWKIIRNYILYLCKFCGYFDVLGYFFSYNSMWKINYLEQRKPFNNELFMSHFHGLQSI